MSQRIDWTKETVDNHDVVLDDEGYYRCVHCDVVVWATGVMVRTQTAVYTKWCCGRCRREYMIG